ncbi:MAG: hypothetical protein F6K31_06160 [Symploca sp. SIO2G7]|nr:hypothetical protein [Symploca sp. SIO2G7]
MSILKPLEPEGMRVECCLNFLGNPGVITQSQLLSGAEQLEFLIKALNHLRESLQEQLDSFICSDLMEIAQLETTVDPKLLERVAACD